MSELNSTGYFLVLDLMGSENTDGKFVTVAQVLHEVLLVAVNMRSKEVTHSGPGQLTHFGLAVAVDEDVKQLFPLQDVAALNATTIVAVIRTLTEIISQTRQNKQRADSANGDDLQQIRLQFNELIEQVLECKLQLNILLLTSSSPSEKWPSLLNDIVVENTRNSVTQIQAKVVILTPVKNFWMTIAHETAAKYPTVETTTIPGTKKHIDRMFKRWLICPPGTGIPLELVIAENGRTKWKISVRAEKIFLDPQLIVSVCGHCTSGSLERVLDFPSAELSFLEFVKVEGICQSLVYGFPHRLLPLDDYSAGPFAVTDNTNRFLDLCNWMMKQSLGLIASFEGSALTHYFVITAGKREEERVLLMQFIAYKDLILPAAEKLQKLSSANGFPDQVSEEFEKLAESLPTVKEYNPMEMEGNLVEVLFKQKQRRPVSRVNQRRGPTAAARSSAKVPAAGSRPEGSRIISTKMKPKAVAAASKTGRFCHPALRDKEL